MNRSSAIRPRVRAVGRVAVTAAMLAGGTTFSAAGLGSIVASPAAVSEPAERSARQIATMPNSCGFVPGIGLRGFQPESYPLVLSQFDGNSSDDPHIPVPHGNYLHFDRTLAHDCSRVIVYNTSQSYIEVDLSTSTATRRVSNTFGFYGISATSDGRFVAFQRTSEGWESVDVETGEFVASWSLFATQSGYTTFSTNGQRTAQMWSDGRGTFRVYVNDLGMPAAPPIIELGDVQATVRLSPSGDFITLRVFEGDTTYVAVYRSNGDLVIRTPALAGVLAHDDHLLLCRADGSYRSDFAGRETLIERFDDYQLVPQEGGNPAVRSAKLETCRSH